MEQFARDAIERLTTRPRPVYETIVVDPLTPLLGAEISGLDLSGELTPEQEKEVKDAFLTHHVLVFRDQNLTPDDHKRFAGLFGPLHPVALAPEDSDPHILEISATRSRAGSPATAGTPTAPPTPSPRSVRCSTSPVFRRSAAAATPCSPTCISPTTCCRRR
jgi:alpha-ketoglutarate-dependent taurine dioxygenase